MYLQTYAQVFTASGSWVAPWNLAGPPSAYAWGPSGTASAGLSTQGGGGAGSGSLGGEPALGGVVPGTVLTVTIAAATATTITGGSVTVTGNPGGNATTGTGGAAGAAPTNTVAFAGQAGGNSAAGSSGGGGGGGGSPGSTGTGGAGQPGVSATGGAGGTAGPGAAGPPSLAGAVGGAGGTGSAGHAGTAPGSGPGGGSGGTIHGPGAVAPGQAVIIWTVFTLPPGPLRGPAGARGRLSGVPVLRPVFPPPTPAPLVLAHRPLAPAPAAARPGRTTARGAPLTLHPATFRPPHRPLAPAPAAARPGRILRPVKGKPVFPVIPPFAYIAPDILKPWKKHAWPRWSWTPAADLVVLDPAPLDPPAMSGRPDDEGPGRAPEQAPGPAGQAARPLEAARRAAVGRAAKALDMGRALDDPDIAASVFYWQQQRNRPKGST